MPELPGLVHIIDMVYIVNSEPLSVFYNPGKSMEFTDICLQRVYIRQCDSCVGENWRGGVALWIKCVGILSIFTTVLYLIIYFSGVYYLLQDEK